MIPKMELLRSLWVGLRVKNNRLDQVYVLGFRDGFRVQGAPAPPKYPLIEPVWSLIVGV